MEKRNRALINTNVENLSLEEITDLYIAYKRLFVKYFCKESASLIDGKKSYVYQHDLFVKNDEFFSGWKTKKNKIQARLNRDNYYVPGGKARDTEEIKKGQAKFNELSLFFEIAGRISAFETMYQDEEFVLPVRNEMSVEKFEHLQQLSNHINGFINASRTAIEQQKIANKTNKASSASESQPE